MKGMITLLLASVLTPVAAVAQEWTTYTYADPGFTIEFPGIPAVEPSTIKDAFGASLPMTRYVVRQEHLIYTLSVVNYSGTNADALSTIADTERSLGASGKVTAATGARIKRHVGRELHVNGSDGSHSAIAIFYVDKHLYTLVVQASPPAAVEESSDAIRFRESLQFSDDGGGFGGFSGLGRIFGGGDGAERTPKVAAKVAADPHADPACVGKSAGDVVQLETTSGTVAATCTLVARPNLPPNEQSAAPVR